MVKTYQKGQAFKMIVYQDIGKGIPIVFIHGLGSKKEAWEPQHELANHFRLIIPDLRGHGDTALDQDITLKNFALDIIYLLDYLKIPKAFICGLSLGGIIAQEIYWQRPEKVSGLVLANTTSYIPALFSYNTIQRSKQLLHNDRERLRTQIVETSLHNQEYKEEATKVFKIRDSYLDCARAPIGINYFMILPMINKPVLLIGSSHDRVTPFLNVMMMRNFIKDSKIILFKNTGHLSNIERKEAFNDAISQFLCSVG
ncbi:alpha/beta hydrolase [Niallia sp. XMNu-256]|uniref:alpha/beta fold hydrolase n=1 Tax=Niallia sp. XMNu-256 TaxID=3082444 RepID=UPI0030CE1E7D